MARIILADEIHTPDSSRYWIAESYAQRLPRASGRRASTRISSAPGWRSAAIPTRIAIPEIPAELIEQTSKVYIEAYETITGKRFVARPFRRHRSRSHPGKSAALFQLNDLAAHLADEAALVADVEFQPHAVIGRLE